MTSTPPFIVLSLPRSRSFWLASFFRYAEKVVTHDLAVECASVLEFQQKLRLVDGTCETGAVLGWRLLRAEMPEARIVVVHRPWQAVAASLAAFGLAPPVEDLKARAVMLALVSAEPGVLSVNFDQLNDPMICQMLFEHCLELPFDWQWWGRLAPLNLQVDMPSRLARLHANYPRLEAFKAEVAARSAVLLQGAQCLN